MQDQIVPLQLLGRLKTAEKHLQDESFVCVYGDSIYEFNLDRMIIEHNNSHAFLSMALLSYKTKTKVWFY